MLSKPLCPQGATTHENVSLAIIPSVSEGSVCHPIEGDSPTLTLRSTSDRFPVQDARWHRRFTAFRMALLLFRNDTNVIFLLMLPGDVVNITNKNFVVTGNCKHGGFIAGDFAKTKNSKMNQSKGSIYGGAISTNTL